jgi:hypothetical protein
MFEEEVCRAVQTNHCGLDALCRRYSSTSAPHDVLRWPHVPSPAEVSKATGPSAEGQKPVPKENAALDEVGKTIENVVSLLRTLAISSAVKHNGFGEAYEDAAIHHCTCRDTEEAEDEDQASQDARYHDDNTKCASESSFTCKEASRSHLMHKPTLLFVFIEIGELRG